MWKQGACPRRPNITCLAAITLIVSAFVGSALVSEMSQHVWKPYIMVRRRAEA